MQCIQLGSNWLIWIQILAIDGAWKRANPLWIGHLKKHNAFNLTSLQSLDIPSRDVSVGGQWRENIA